MSKALTQGPREGQGSAPSRLTGFIDAITENRVFGWAWDPQKAAARIAIRVEVAGKQVATALADQTREDLATNKVGDGAHAFEVALPAGTAPDKMGVYALCPDTGERVELMHRPLETTLDVHPGGDELRGTVHALVRSQRLLSGRVQNVVEALDQLRGDLTKKSGDESAQMRLTALEVAVTRIDERLRDLAAKIDEISQQPKDHITRVIACAAAAVAGAAFLVALIG